MDDKEQPVADTSTSPTKEVLAKRFLALVGIILFVSALSLVAKLASNDAPEYRADLDAITILAAPPLDGTTDFSAKQTQDEYARWFQQSDAKLFNNGIAAREQVIADLRQAGADDKALISATKNAPNKFTVSEYLLVPSDQKYVSIRYWHFTINRVSKTSDRIRQLEAFYARRKARAVSAVDTHARILPLPPRYNPATAHNSSEKSLKVRALYLTGRAIAP